MGKIRKDLPAGGGLLLSPPEMNMMNIQVGQVTLFLLAFVFYFIFRFGMISRGRSNEIIQFVGGFCLLMVFILTLVFYGWKSAGVLVLVFWFVITPINELILHLVSKKLYGHYGDHRSLKSLKLSDMEFDDEDQDKLNLVEKNR